MPIQPTPPASAGSGHGANGHSTVHDIFVLSDEQILEIEPEPQDIEASADVRGGSRQANVAPASPPAGSRGDEARIDSSAEHGSRETGHENRDAAPGPTTTTAAPPAPQTPPAWLASQMNDAWNGEEARALWQRMQTTENEAAAYREVFAKPEDARAIKALYPNGVAQAQATAERARLLDEIDGAYFAAQAATPEQARASRAQLAAMMLREDPTAFREMVFEGLRALEAAEQGTPASTTATNVPRLAQALRANQPNVPRANQPDVNVAPPLRAASPDQQAANAPANEAHLAAYSAFERAANSELERTVGTAIDRALHQALPNIEAADRSGNAANVGARFSASPGSAEAHSGSLQARLSQAIREDVERALQSDRQLGEQVAQILSSRRLDESTRAQVVRLINDRALQLVPSAAKRALNDWTQATLATHRSRTARTETAASRRELATASAAPRDLRSQTPAETARPAQSNARPAPTKSRINYGKLSDEQILDL
jgi:hypothetical protein